VSARQARSRPANVVPGADVLERTGRRLQSVALPDPFEALEDIRIGKTLEKVLVPIFSVLGVTLEDEQLVDSFDKDAGSHVTAARGTAAPLYVINVPRFVISDPKTRNRSAILSLKSLFKGGSRVVLFSEGEPHLRYAYDIMFKEEWAPEVSVRFVSWEFVKEIRDAAEVERPKMVKFVLGDETFAPQNPSIEALGPNDRRFLTEYMRDQAEVNQAYFDNLVLALELPSEFRSEVAGPWTGDSAANARRLLEWSFKKQWYPEGSGRAGYTVAGALLEELSRQTGGDKAKRVGQLVIDHGLIREQRSLDALRRELALND
jgi:hypothetical protein